MRDSLSWLSLLAAWSWSLTATVAAERPNVLLICVDDLKPVLGCFGDKIARTPNIDRLASRGLRFDAAYCNQAVCAPSRNALLTGLRSETLGIYDLGTNFRKSRPNAVTLPQYFKQHGYRSEGLGKIFHVGHGNKEDPLSWTVPHWHPLGRRYQRPENRPTNPKKSAKGLAFEDADVADSAYPDGKTAREAARRIQRHAKGAGPFFMAVGFSKPHLPFCAPSKYWALYDRTDFSVAETRTPPIDAPSFAPTKSAELIGYRGIPKKGGIPDELARTLILGYYAAASYVDAQIGLVLDSLDDSGLSENTIIVLWGDHGWHLGDHGMWCKHTNYEQATRIPLIVVAPGATSKDTVSKSLVESVDIYPTLCKLAGLPIPEGLDGVDFTTVLRNPDSSTKEAIFHCYPRGNRLGRAVRTKRYRLVEWATPGAESQFAEYELYDYDTDPSERRNLANDQPEVLRELQKFLAHQPAPRPQIYGAAAGTGK